MALATIGLWITILCFMNFISFTFLKRMNASIEFRDAYSPLVLKLAKIPPFAIVIALFSIFFGFVLQLIEFIFKK
jgi:ABC-type transporter Mla maintaining outer membrane lipid asymmetry permease subunit MlaE